MKRLILTFGAFVLTAGALVARNPQADTTVVRGAELHLAETVHDFGDVPRRGDDLRCEIAFTNTGDAPLVVMRLITSSSCLRASCSRRPVAPGASGVIRIGYQPLKRDAGAFSRIVRIGSNAVAGDRHITVRGNSFEETVPVRNVKRGKTRLKIK
ncbi:MAG: DUF1573 domain-containing protein [Alistipes sp.]|nr:DUF1573 domain-containing protein [Alistipes sp.]